MAIHPFVTLSQHSYVFRGCFVKTPSGLGFVPGARYSVYVALQAV
jgi:hypothetical protein